MNTRYLLDKSAFARWPGPAVAAVLDPLSWAGSLAVCGAIEMEILHSARSTSDAERIRDELRGFDRFATPDETWDRAVEVQTLLIAAGNGRALCVADLIVAAVAERHGATVLHYDGDFDMVAEVTGRPTRWVVAAATAH